MVQGSVCGCRRKGKGEKGFGRVSIDNVSRKRKIKIQCYYIGEEKDTLIMCADVVF